MCDVVVKLSSYLSLHIILLYYTLYTVYSTDRWVLNKQENVEMTDQTDYQWHNTSFYSWEDFTHEIKFENPITIFLNGKLIVIQTIVAL